MNSRRYGMALLAVLLLLTPGWALAINELGDIATDFTLLDEDGVEHSLYDFWGKVILLNFSAMW